MEPGHAKEIDHLACHVPSAQLPRVDQYRMVIEPQAFPQWHGRSGIDLKPLEIYAARNDLHWTLTAIRMADVKQPLPRPPRQNDCGVGLRNEQSPHAFDQSEQVSPPPP